MDENTTQLTLTGSTQTRLVDKSETDKWDVAVNRYANFNHMRNTPPGERGWLGNPFRPHEDGLRGDHIERFREAFIEKLEDDEEFRRAVDELEGKTLACNCGRERCHGEIIVTYLEDGIDAIRPNGQE